MEAGGILTGMKPIYIATFHQSRFGKLMGMTVPRILDSAIQGACRQIGIAASALDVGSVGAACNFPLNEQGLLAGLMANTPGLEGKPIEAVENACASGGQAMLSVIQKLQLGMGETGIAVGYEKMRDAEGKMDGKLIGKVLGYFSDPDERAGWAQATDPIRKAGRDVLRPAGAYRAMRTAYRMAGVKPEDVNVAEVHDCFSVMGALATEVIGKAEPGAGAQYWVEGKASPQ